MQSPRRSLSLSLATVVLSLGVPLACSQNGGTDAGVPRDAGNTSSSSSTGGTSTSSSTGGTSSSSSTGGTSSSSSTGGTSTSSSTGGSSGVHTGETVAHLKTLIAANANCAGSTGTNCSYNSAPYYDAELANVIIVSTKHADFDNSYRWQDGGYQDQEAFYIADSATAAAGAGIEVVSPPYTTIPAFAVGDRVTVVGTLRSNFGNTFLRFTSMTNSGASGATITPLTVAPTDVQNTNMGAEGPDGGCARNRVETDTVGEPDEGTLVDVTLPGGGLDITYAPNSHRFSVDGKLMVGDNFSILTSFGDGGITTSKKITRLRGFSYFSYGCRKIQPRTVDDLQIQ